jgi:hypothetical protein
MEAKYFFLPERRRRTALHYIKKNKREKFPESTRKTLLNRTHTHNLTPTHNPPQGTAANQACP